MVQVGMGAPTPQLPITAFATKQAEYIGSFRYGSGDFVRPPPLFPLLGSSTYCGLTPSRHLALPLDSRWRSTLSRRARSSSPRSSRTVRPLLPLSLPPAPTSSADA